MKRSTISVFHAEQEEPQQVDVWHEGELTLGGESGAWKLWERVNDHDEALCRGRWPASVGVVIGREPSSLDEVADWALGALAEEVSEQPKLRGPMIRILDDLPLLALPSLRELLGRVTARIEEKHQAAHAAQEPNYDQAFERAEQAILTPLTKTERRLVNEALRRLRAGEVVRIGDFEAHQR